MNYETATVRLPITMLILRKARVPVTHNSLIPLPGLLPNSYGKREDIKNSSLVWNYSRVLSVTKLIVFASIRVNETAAWVSLLLKNALCHE